VADSRRRAGSWLDFGRFLWDVFGPVIKPAWPSIAAFLLGWYIMGERFFISKHEVYGWVIVLMVAVACLCATLLVLDVRRWSRARRRRPLLVIEHGGPDHLWWHMGGMASTPAMQIVGTFHVTNASPANVFISRSTLVIAYRL
jgi:drug/metabolite transporter (DMT)-like permease